jgi:hypothetical protein
MGIRLEVNETHAVVFREKYLEALETKVKLEDNTEKFKVFWDVLPCSQIDVDLRFRGACCLHHQGDDNS